MQPSRSIIIVLSPHILFFSLQITIVTHFPASFPNSEDPNITYHEFDAPYFNAESINYFKSLNDRNYIEKYVVFQTFRFLDEFYEDPSIQDLYRRRESFDLTVTELAGSMVRRKN